MGRAARLLTRAKLELWGLPGKGREEEEQKGTAPDSGNSFFLLWDKGHLKEATLGRVWQWDTVQPRVTAPPDTLTTLSIRQLHRHRPITCGLLQEALGHFRSTEVPQEAVPSLRPGTGNWGWRVSRATLSHQASESSSEVITSL